MTAPLTLNQLETFGLSIRSLLSELEDDFPPVTPSPQDSIEQIMYRSGQRSVVEHIYRRIEDERISQLS